MLLLTRKKGQSIFIGDDIKITIVSCMSQVQVGISAPDHISIVRDEIADRTHTMKVNEAISKIKGNSKDNWQVIKNMTVSDFLKHIAAQEEADKQKKDFDNRDGEEYLDPKLRAADDKIFEQFLYNMEQK